MLRNLFGKAEPVSESGQVKWFDAQKGFGFIERPDGSDIFVHYSDIVGSGFRTLNEGQKVEFQVSQSPKGPQAVNVVSV
jgi:CspA family cold shock protein